jgi:hypothetical protein
MAPATRASTSPQWRKYVAKRLRAAAPDRGATRELPGGRLFFSSTHMALALW